MKSVFLRMAYDVELADRIHRILQEREVNFYDKKMFGGLCYMVDDKMCLGVMEDRIMCRIGPTVYETALEIEGASEMNFTGRSMKGYVFVSDSVLGNYSELAYWVDLCLAFNPEAKKSKKRKKKNIK